MMKVVGCKIWRIQSAINVRATLLNSLRNPLKKLIWQHKHPSKINKYPKEVKQFRCNNKKRLNSHRCNHKKRWKKHQNHLLRRMLEQEKTSGMFRQLAMRRVILLVIREEWALLHIMIRNKESETKNEKGNKSNKKNCMNSNSNRLNNSNNKMQDCLVIAFHLEEDSQWWVAVVVDNLSISLKTFSVQAHRFKASLDKTRLEVVAVIFKILDKDNRDKASNSNNNHEQFLAGPLMVLTQVCLTRTLDKTSDRITRVEKDSSIQYLNSSNRCLLKKSKKCTNQLTKKQLKSYQYLSLESNIAKRALMES